MFCRSSHSISWLDVRLDCLILHLLPLLLLALYLWQWNNALDHIRHNRFVIISSIKTRFFGFNPLEMLTLPDTEHFCLSKMPAPRSCRPSSCQPFPRENESEGSVEMDRYNYTVNWTWDWGIQINCLLLKSSYQILWTCLRQFTIIRQDPDSWFIQKASLAWSNVYIGF